MSAEPVELNALEAEIRACRLCEAELPLGPRPVFIARPEARLLIAAQAPGRRVHETGLPFNDPSGDRLRDWLGIDRETFYHHPAIAIVPMGFCFPGTGRGGDPPPRPECAATWRRPLLVAMPRVETTVVIGRYALGWHLGLKRSQRVTDLVADWQRLAPAHFPLPHPSPRNNRWLRNNPWFEAEVIPALQTRVATLLAPAATSSVPGTSGPPG